MLSASSIALCVSAGLLNLSLSQPLLSSLAYKDTRLFAKSQCDGDAITVSSSASA